MTGPACSCHAGGRSGSFGPLRTTSGESSSKSKQVLLHGAAAKRFQNRLGGWYFFPSTGPPRIMPGTGSGSSKFEDVDCRAVESESWVSEMGNGSVGAFQANDAMAGDGIDQILGATETAASGFPLPSVKCFLKRRRPPTHCSRHGGRPKTPSPPWRATV